MPFTQDNLTFSAVAASTISPNTPVALVGGASLVTASVVGLPVQLAVMPVTAETVRPAGIVQATGPQGEAVTVYEDYSREKVVAAASVGIGGEVSVASTNGAVGPLAAASGTVKWALGVALENAGAGEVLTIKVGIRQVGGLQ